MKCLKCGWIFNEHFIAKFTAKCASEVFLKIGQYLINFIRRKISTAIHKTAHNHTQETCIQTYAHKQQKLAAYKQCIHSTLLRLADIAQ